MNALDYLKYNIPVKEINSQEWNILRREGICNGFGPSSWKILNWILKKVSPAFSIASADIHDLNYFRWGTEEDRKRADEGFLKYMLRDCQNFDWLKRVKYVLLSYLYFIAVKLLWKKHFQYK